MSDKLRKLQKKADKLMQIKGREVYSKCLVCGNEMSCHHHYFPKSTSTALRYDWENLIPLCQSCHFSHHNGNPEIHNAVNKIKGEEWLENLRIKKRNALKQGWKPTIKWIENIIEALK